MSIKLNTKETDITVYDKVNLNHATGNEVVPLVSVIRGEFKDVLFNIVADSLSLNENEKTLYRVINSYFHNKQTNKDGINLDYLIKWIAKDTNMSPTTYRRATDTLIAKGVIKYTNDRRDVAIINSFNISLITNVAKYIVIEVKPCVATS